MTRLAQSDALFCYDGSFEGFLSLVFKAYSMHVIPGDIQKAGCEQPALGQDIVDVPTEFALAERVKVGLCNKAGYRTYGHLERAFCTGEDGCERDAFAYVVLAMAGGRRAAADLADPVVSRVEQLSNKASNEAEYLRQFVRFELMDNGVYVAVTNPKCNVLPYVMGHFVERLNTQPFLIYDEVHHLAAYYDMREVGYVRIDDIELGSWGEGEELYQQLWKTFYDSISNEQRFNPDLRRRHMPLRFWKNLTEFKLAV